MWTTIVVILQILNCRRLGWRMKSKKAKNDFWNVNGKAEWKLV